MAVPKFFDRRADVKRSRNRLPHWQQNSATYFVTYRLADSLPRAVVEAWKEERSLWLRYHPKPWDAAEEIEYVRRFARIMEVELDRLHGSCPFRNPKARTIVSEGLAYFEGVRYEQHAWVIMPNHVHALFSVRDGWTLEKVVKGWKGWSARALNRLNASKGVVWEKDYFDRLIRSAAHFQRCAQYIRQNPSKAKLGSREYALWESEMVRAILDVS